LQFFIFLPIRISYSIFYIYYPLGEKVEECAVLANEVSTIAARIDGVEVKEIRKYTVQ
jgi:intergrase/recombinase